MYAGLTNETIDALQDSLGKTLPEDYVNFLKYTNGTNIFSDSISIWGMRTSNARRGDEAIQPYDLVSLNEERIGEIPDSLIIS
ncbi:SMI1/KNR4 family protein [Pelosinus baikalensis]|uniref:SMI1/KNR4 family protein n=1 Tax=Pelosinus baikalensis TaxID=2892015 RepID=A0ABS8HYA5_9FIRM|nr:SMI1/KNR4 family protein [Pelosinus baikalensis]